MDELKLTKYSFSKLKNFINCKYAFYRNYFENDRDTVENGTSEFGSFCHKILEMYERGELEDYEMLNYYLQHYDEEVKSSFVIQLTEKFSKDFSSMYFEDGKSYFQNFTGFDNIKILESEYEFAENINNKYLLVGKIDLVAEDEEGNLIVIDHKSKSKFKNKAELAEYAKQLYIYALAVKNKYGKFPQKLMFNMFRKGNWITIDFDMERYEETLKWVDDIVNEIEICMDFEPNGLGSFYCFNFCPYRYKCEYNE